MILWKKAKALSVICSAQASTVGKTLPLLFFFHTYVVADSICYASQETALTILRHKYSVDPTSSAFSCSYRHEPTQSIGNA